MSINLGEPVYSDRGYTVVAMPDFLKDATLVQTANEDKADDNPAYLSFTVAAPSIIYVAYDSRLLHRPVWLSTWVDTGQALRLSGHTKPFTIYAKDYPAGTVTLGGNTYGGSMYVVAIQSVKVASPIEPPTPPPTGEQAQSFEILSNEAGVLTIACPPPLKGLKLTFDVRSQVHGR